MQTRTCVAAGAVVLIALFFANAPAAAAAKPITGKLSKPGYTVIALAANGKAKPVRAGRDRFKLRAPAKSVTLHLRRSNGKYAGPVVMAVAQGGKRAILGVRAGARLGRIAVRRGYARARRPRAEWLVEGRYSRARRGIPIGARRYGRVRSRKAHGGVPGDRDLDGIPDPLDIDDDGDRVLDNLDSSRRRARASQFFHASGAFFVASNLHKDLSTAANANAPGMSDAQLEAALPTWGEVTIQMLPGDFAELDCGSPQSRTDPTLGGLVYCSKGGTARVVGVVDYSKPVSTWPRFPECCDSDDGDGFGTFALGPTANAPEGERVMTLRHGATSSQIGTGDVLIQRVTTAGKETSYLATVQYVFSTMHTLVSYDDGQGNSETVSYPVGMNDPGTRENGFPVKAGPGGDVVLTLTLWRPQRRPIPPETAEWIDIGGMNYRAFLADGDPGTTTCDQSAYSTSDPNLSPTDTTIQAGGGGFNDLAGDQPASPGNTLTYRLNLSECLRSAGLSFNVGERRGFGLQAVTPQLTANDESGVSVFFERTG